MVVIVGNGETGLKLLQLLRGSRSTADRFARSARVLMLGLLMAAPLVCAGGEFTLGVVNERPDKPDFALGQFGDMHQYLRRTLAGDGVRVAALVITQTLDEMAERLRSREVDAVVEGVMPSFYLDDATRLLEPELLVWRKGQRTYHTVFFVRRDSTLQRLGDLGGRTVAFESHRSTSAFFIPMAVLAETGLATTTGDAGHGAVRYVFAGSEDNQGYWVVKGRADAGAFNDGDWARLPDRVRSQLRVIHRTRPVLRWLVSYRRGFDAQTRSKVSQALVRMHESESGAAALRQAARITRIDPLNAGDRANLDAWRPSFEAVKPLL